MTNEELLEFLKDIAEMTDDANPESYRNDDPQRCLDVIFFAAIQRLDLLGDSTYKERLEEIE